MEPEKIKHIKNWSSPRTIKQLQQFLGLCGYYRRFIKDYASITAPSNNLLKKDKEWFWDLKCERAFIGLKEKLISYPIHRQPDFDRPFILHTDASDLAKGAILAQNDNGREYVCLYALGT